MLPWLPASPLLSGFVSVVSLVVAASVSASKNKNKLLQDEIITSYSNLYMPDSTTFIIQEQGNKALLITTIGQNILTTSSW